MEVKKDFAIYVKQIERSINYIACTITSPQSMYFDDVKQELLIASWQSYQTYDPEKAEFSTYAVHRMKKLAINLRRRLENRKYLTIKYSHSKKLLRFPLVLYEDANTFGVSMKHNQLEEEQEEEQTKKLEEREIRVFIRNISIVLRRNYHYNEQFRKANYIFSQFILGVSLSECARRLNVSVTWLSRIFQGLIIPVARLVASKGVDIEDSVVYNAVRILKPKEENMAKKIKKKSRKLADAQKRHLKKKPVKAQKAARPEKGGKRVVSKDGLVAKIKFLEVNFVNKGRTRSDAVKGLTERYPDMSINYARTIVYSQMKEYDWAASEPKAKKKKSISKKAAPTKSKKAAVSSKKNKPTKGGKSKKKKIEEDDDDFAYEDEEEYEDDYEGDDEEYEDDEDDDDEDDYDDDDDDLDF